MLDCGNIKQVGSYRSRYQKKTRSEAPGLRIMLFLKPQAQQARTF